MSAGQLFDLIMPVVFLISALLSSLVLASARRRFHLGVALALAVGTLFLPFIVFPLYLASLIWTRKKSPPSRWRFGLPLLYALIATGAVMLFFSSDSRSVDAHLARATQAKLVDDTQTAIREYRQALSLEDDAHTHKLLAIELANAGEVSAAITEFRVARDKGEPDDLISFQLGLLHERAQQTTEAQTEFSRFLESETCRRGEKRCEAARSKIMGKSGVVRDKN